MNEDHDVSAKSFQELLGSLDYEKQFFGVSPHFLLEEYKKSILTTIHTLLNEAEQKMIKITDSAEHGEIRAMVGRIWTKYITAIQNSLQNAKPKFHAAFEIPPHVLLPEDQIHAKNYTKNDVDEADAEIKNLEKRYERAVCMETLLKQEVLESGNLDILETKVMELEEKKKIFLFESKVKKESWDQIRNMIFELDQLNLFAAEIV